MRNLDPNATGGGLYSPALDSDACGVGLICNLRGEKSHKLVKDALQILVNLTHRGAAGCDACTGDGAGIVMQVPDRFLRSRCGADGIKLPPAGEYGVGGVFLPRIEAERQHCVDLFEQVVKDEGQQFLGWRDVPVNREVIGEVAASVEPVIRQIFIGRGPGLADDAAFERKLYVIRRVMENAIRASELTQKKFFYVPSLSCRTLNYKGLMLADQVENFYLDLADEEMESALALVHQRYSTNTFPTWELAQPFRFLCHNGEINTLRGNVNWMTARQALFASPLFGDDMAKIFPVATPGASDSAILDNALELLYHTGRSLPHSIMMMIPEAWQNHDTMPDSKKAFYEYHSCLMEPWDGPASIPFTDGQVIGAVLDRNGLRPSRYTVTKDGWVIMGSETGVLEIDPANVERHGRLQPGRMFLADLEKGRIVDDEEVKEGVTGQQPYRTWLDTNLTKFQDLPKVDAPSNGQGDLTRRQQLYGYTVEDKKIILAPMARKGVEPTGSMGNDTPLAVLSERPQLLYTYFKQLFAQVTNPPLDAIRELIVTSVITNIGAEQDLFQATPEHCRQLRLDSPVLSPEDMVTLRALGETKPHLQSVTLPMLFPADGDGDALRQALDELFAKASAAIDDGASILILSDHDANEAMAPIPALLATAGLHHHLIRSRQRTRCGIVVESGEPREVHHFCMLHAFGAGAVCPYLAFETLEQLLADGDLLELTRTQARKHYVKAIHKGILKVMSKMGISTLQSYRGAQIVEAVGLNQEVIDRYFTWTPSRVAGVGLDELAQEALSRHRRAFPAREVPARRELDAGGQYQWRRNGELRILNPLTIAKLQQAVRNNDRRSFSEFSSMVNDSTKQLCTLRGLLEFDTAGREPVPLEEVEPWTEIVQRFKTGAMSYGSLSAEAHETLAMAMNQIGGKSNSGEGGEDARRYKPDIDGWRRSSAIKQVASGRFGVTSNYLWNARELQIKMAQGAKPGEGGQLPGFKVYPWIAKTRFSTPYVTLISPPPHHDIYSIEDLAQLIHDLKNANHQARICVKLVSEVGVGTVAAGVSKGKSDVVLISGYDGGTGASPQTSIKHAGLPWELGLSETHQTLVENDLRSRIRVEVDGKLLTGRDVAIATLLGAEEFGFSAGPLVSIGCIMMRVCHLNTCPVGVATQNPDLRAKFAGKPEYVINFMRFVAEELREIMAQLGFRTLNEMIGQVQCLKTKAAIDHWKAKGLDYSKILRPPQVRQGVGIYQTVTQDHNLDKALDHQLLEQAEPALLRREKVTIDLRIRNINRTVGTMLSSQISRYWGEAGLPDDTITVNCRGSAGQSFSAFGARGLTFRVQGEANDYFGKGLSGAKLIIQPPPTSTVVPEANIIIGNVAFYGATGGEAYVRGLAGERFCVRNSGVRAVVEGVGDHGCEYMTGGRTVILGPTGRNFAAGMSGGVAYVWDRAGDFARDHLNPEMVELEEVATEDDLAELKDMIEKHLRYTGSTVAEQVLAAWPDVLREFVKVMPVDYKRALQAMAEESLQAENDNAMAMA